jgi:hypothetical protein
MPHLDAPSRPSLFHRAAVVTAVALSTLLVGVCIALLVIMPGCGPSAGSQVKPILRQVDEHVQLACEGLAQALAERSGADASRIIATSCAIEAITRGMRELLLSQQIEAAKAAGVAVPNINSAALEPDPYNPAEATAE